MAACSVCGFTNPDGAIACQACGTQLVAIEPAKARPGEAACATHRDRPAVTVCERCGTFYCGSCLMRGWDGKLLCEPCRSREVALPWDKRSELGTLRAWWQTSMLLLRSPSVTLAAAQRGGSIGSSVLFTLIATVAGFATTVFAYSVLIIAAIAFGSSQADKLEGGAGMAGFGIAAGVGITIGYAVMAFAGQLASLFVLSAIQHGALYLLGERQIGGYPVTLRAHALALAPYVLGLIPFCGVMVMGMWTLVLQVLSLSSLQRVSPGKAAIAVLSPVAFGCVCIGGAYALFMAAAVSMMGDLSG